MHNLSIIIFLLLRKTRSFFFENHILFIMINLFDYNKLYFIQVFAYINENVLHIINNILYLYNIKTFSSDNIIYYIKVKTYIKVKFFICVKERYTRKN